MTQQTDVALITGSSRGIGAETARLFASHGYAIVLNYINSDKQARYLQDEILDMGVGCIAVKANVADEKEVSRLFTDTDKLGSLKVLVNNAGILQQQCGLEDISAERFRRMLDINVMSCFMCTQQAIKRMAYKHGGQGGAIVNVSSMAAKTGSPFEYVDYAATKGAMDTLTKGAAMELADEGIRVNGVRPGLIYTEMHASGGEAGRVERLKNRIPLKRGGKPEEVAQAIYWLASDNSSFVTGTFIDTAGGL